MEMHTICHLFQNDESFFALFAEVHLILIKSLAIMSHEFHMLIAFCA